MKIVLLDGFTINPGDVDWSALSPWGDLKVYERTTSEQVYERSKEAEILLTNKTPLSAKLIKRLDNLKYVGELATGYDNIAIKAAAKRKIPVCNVPGYSTPSVAQMTWAMILELTNEVARRDGEVKRGAWIRSKDFSFGSKGLLELQGKTLGLIGLGAIGTEVAKIGKAFGMKVVAAVRHPKNYNLEGVTIVKDKNRVYEKADVLSLHLPLNKESEKLINAMVFKKMKPSAFLINTARGGLIDEEALFQALLNKVIAGAAVDVLSAEPQLPSNLLLSAPNCLITPHVAWATKESRQRLLKIAGSNIKGFREGKLQNVVNGVK